MPVRPELRHFYRGPAWRTTRARILRRAGKRCENCGKPDRTTVLTCTGRGRMFWMPANGGRWRDECGKLYRHLTPPWLRYGISEPRAIKVVLAVAHVNHEAGDDRDENLRAWCAWCHLNHDKLKHKQTRCERKDLQRPLLRMAS